MGPAAENVDTNLFQPCQVDRKRGGTPKPKVQKEKKVAKFSRGKRSESFAAVNWLWKDPENIPVVFDSSCKQLFFVDNVQDLNKTKNLL